MMMMGVSGPVGPPRAAVERSRRLALPVVTVVLLGALPHGPRVALGVAAVAVLASPVMPPLLLVAPLLPVPIPVALGSPGGLQLVEDRGVVGDPGARVGLGIESPMAVAMAPAQVAHAPHREHQQQEEDPAHRPAHHRAQVALGEGLQGGGGEEDALPGVQRAGGGAPGGRRDGGGQGGRN